MANPEVRFDYRHYVPILRQKEAEMEALSELLPGDKEHLTPLIEVTPRLVKSHARKGFDDNGTFIEVVKQIVRCWGQCPVFIDVDLLERYLPPAKPGDNWLRPLGFAARFLNLPFVPVTGLHRSMIHESTLADLASQDGRGICLRLS